MKQMPADREKVYGKQEERGWLREYSAEIFLFILNCFLWDISGLKRLCCRVITDPAWPVGQKDERSRR